MQPTGLESGANGTAEADYDDDGAVAGDLATDLGLPIGESHQSHPWGVFFTVLGTVLLDFDADSCQSPSRAYLLDVTVPGVCACVCVCGAYARKGIEERKGKGKTLLLSIRSIRLCVASHVF